MTTVEGMPGTVSPDMLVLARELQQALADAGVPAKLIGGTAVALRCTEMARRGLSREYHDIDICARARDAGKLERVLTSLGYEAHKHFNAVNYGRQQMFTSAEVHLDVFLDTLRMCQDLYLADRLSLDDHCSLTPSDLALSKLQIVQLTEKDKADLLAILIEHEPVAGSEHGLNTTRVADICRANWGWWKSATITLDACRAYAEEHLAPADQKRASEHIDALLVAIETAPKTARWRARARIGTRAKWYVLPEETQQA